MERCAIHFLVDTYETERLKVLSVWSMFRDEELPFPPHPTDPRGRSVLEHMEHQCVSENAWFCKMLAVDVAAPPLPAVQTSRGFVSRYGKCIRQTPNRPEVKADATWWDRKSRSSTFRAPARGSSSAASPTLRTTADSKWRCSACWAEMSTATTDRRPTQAGRWYTSRYRCSSGKQPQRVVALDRTKILGGEALCGKPPDHFRRRAERIIGAEQDLRRRRHLQQSRQSRRAVSLSGVIVELLQLIHQAL